MQAVSSDRRREALPAQPWWEEHPAGPGIQVNKIFWGGWVMIFSWSQGSSETLLNEQLPEQLRWCFSQNTPSFIPNTFPRGFSGIWEDQSRVAWSPHDPRV